MSKVTEAIIASSIVATGIGLLIVNNMFSGLISFPGVDIGLPKFFTFRNAGILITFLGIFYLGYVIIASFLGFGESREEYKCTYCGDTLTSKEALREHIEKYHKGGTENVKDFSETSEENFSE